MPNEPTCGALLGNQPLSTKLDIPKPGYPSNRPLWNRGISSKRASSIRVIGRALVRDYSEQYGNHTVQFSDTPQATLGARVGCGFPVIQAPAYQEVLILGRPVRMGSSPLPAGFVTGVPNGPGCRHPPEDNPNARSPSHQRSQSHGVLDKKLPGSEIRAPVVEPQLTEAKHKIRNELIDHTGFDLSSKISMVWTAKYFCCRNKLCKNVRPPISHFEKGNSTFRVRSKFQEKLPCPCCFLAPSCKECTRMFLQKYCKARFQAPVRPSLESSKIHRDLQRQPRKGGGSFRRSQPYS